jgi:hypothetical protein
MFSHHNFFFHLLTFQTIFLLTTELDLFLDDLPLFPHHIIWIMFCFYEFLIISNDPVIMVSEPRKRSRRD